VDRPCLFAYFNLLADGWVMGGGGWMDEDKKTKKKNEKATLK